MTVVKRHGSGRAILKVALARTRTQLLRPRVWLGIGIFALIVVGFSILFPITLLLEMGAYHGFLSSLSPQGGDIGRTFLVPAISASVLMVPAFVILSLLVEVIRVSCCHWFRSR